jgi:hypothetical protein
MRSDKIDTDEFEEALEICLLEHYGSGFLEILRKANGMTTDGLSNSNQQTNYRMMLYGAYTALNENV